MKKTYEPETKRAIEQVIDVFNDYIRTSTHFELLWSDKVGYIYISLLNLPKKRHSIFTIISLIVQRLAIPSRRICCVKKSAFLPSGKSPMRRYQVTLAMPFIWRRNLRSSFMARIFFTTSSTQMDVVSMTMK